MKNAITVIIIGLAAMLPSYSMAQVALPYYYVTEVHFLNDNGYHYNTVRCVNAPRRPGFDVVSASPVDMNEDRMTSITFQCWSFEVLDASKTFWVSSNPYEG